MKTELDIKAVIGAEKKMTSKQTKEAKQTLSRQYRPTFSFLKDKNGLPRITICTLFLKEGEQEPIAKGYAFCSIKNNEVLKKAKGMRIAYGRAIHALLKQENIAPIKSYYLSNAVIMSIPVKELERDSSLLEYYNKGVLFEGFKGYYLGL